ncbi:hypothetical protein LEP1GSC043_3681 [Leptospira weilii str. Ecochallenge]|uniref:Uncharacterized protein n=1 Tax=Leptospira weilii str. Ecochallenge TaxID=1049986 RepID=N1U892_9LEPT|nr:hypothetical protein LEP1GSC043_3681 [Leptospira weilii str. Ecochallenge]
MGLLERVSKLVRSDSSRVSSATSSSREKKSLLKKSESFQRKQGFLQKALGMRKEIEKKETFSSASSQPFTDPSVQSKTFSEESADSEYNPQSDLSHSEEFSLPELSGDTYEKKTQNEFSDFDFDSGISGSEDSFPDLSEEFSASEEIHTDETPSAEFAVSNEVGDDISFDDLFEDTSPEHSAADMESATEADSEEIDAKDLGEEKKQKAPNLDDSITSIKEDPFEDWVKEAEREAHRTPPKKDPNVSASEKSEFLFDDDSNFTTSPIDLQIASRKNWRIIFLFSR